MSKIVIKKLTSPLIRPSHETKLVLLGLTPGRQQHVGLESAKYPRHASFKGYMRKQMHEWFSILGITDIFNIENENTLFNQNYAKKVFITSVLRDPVYICSNGEFKNYSGRNPLPWNHSDLMQMMDRSFKNLSKLPPGCLITPMGKIVSESIQNFSNLDLNHHILHDFPHELCQKVVDKENMTAYSRC